MDENYNSYKIWAPDDALWSQWAKPVLFSKPVQADSQFISIPTVKWAPPPDRKTALILDLPGHKGVQNGLALARMGYRPVPLYNGVAGSSKHSALIDVTNIVEYLHKGAKQLATVSIPLDAPPVFLLDSDRMNGKARRPGKFDNRWCVFAQDMPSAAFLLRQGIERVYVRSNSIQNDLSHILLRYKEKGIRIFRVTSADLIKELEIVKPSQFEALLYRFKTMLGLSRNAAGGFGGIVPEPTQGSGSRYYGIG